MSYGSRKGKDHDGQAKQYKAKPSASARKRKKAREGKQVKRHADRLRAKRDLNTLLDEAPLVAEALRDAAEILGAPEPEVREALGYPTKDV